MKIFQKIIWPALFCHTAIFAQVTGTIDVNVQFPSDPQTVLIQLLSAPAKTLVKTEISETDGTCSFQNLPKGNYIISIDDGKYLPYQSEVVSVTSEKQKSTITIVLVAAKTNELGEVVVQKKKPAVENKIDKTVVNVEALITTSGGDALDVLEKSPGILVNQDGTISYKGKTGVAVFIDGKPSYLSGTELEAYLKSLPASTLSQIELMTNPPAKFDAAGSGGVINIITKRSKARGFNGSASARVRMGKYATTGEGLNVNYIDDKIRIFGNANYNFQHPRNELYIYRRFKNEDLSTKSYFDQYSFLTGKHHAATARLGMDYYASENTTFGLNVNGMVRNGKRTSEVESVLRNASFELDSTIIADNGTENRFRNAGINLNFRRDLGNSRKITADVDYLNYHNDIDQRFRNFVYQPDNALTDQDEQLGDLPSNIDIVSIKADYVQPLENDGLFETGYKLSVSKTDNVADYRDIVDGDGIPNYDMSNHFKYDEVINAAYVNFNKSYKRFTFQTGLRLEVTQSKGNQLGNELQAGQKFKNDYTSLFPTVYVQYKLDSIGNHQLVTSYGKRITRPYYEDLNPFVSPLDKFTFYAGNPYLDPTFSHTVDLSYRFKGYFSATLSHSFVHDDIAETIEINNGIYYSRPGNIGKSRSWAFAVNAQIPLAQWFSSNIYSEANYSEYRSKLYTGELDSSGTYWHVSVNNQFKFDKNWSAELSGMYQTDIVSTQFILGRRGNINIGIQRKLFNGNGSLKVSGTDIFMGNIYTGTINNLYLTDATWINKPDSRALIVAFNYSFGKAFQPKNQYDATGADSEKNRVKG